MHSRYDQLQSFISSIRKAGVKNTWQNALAMLRARWYLRHATVLGSKARLWGRPSIQNWGILTFGERVRLVSTIATIELVAMPGGVLDIGSNTCINYGCSIAANLKVSIGADCSIGTYVNIMDNNFHRLEPDRRYETPESKPVILEDNVWLGARVIVLPGVTIGSGSVVGAGSVVTRDIPPLSVAAGIPARVIRKLSNES
ncbi:MAG: hypothetical protein MUO62_14615 [Anaerolineales bacterium]|nr:hypothetical protein [Anaerolineales bacterium]